MEEILASIRRIISEDETPEADAKATPPAGEPMPAAAAMAEEDEDDPPAAAAPVPMAAPEPEPAPPPAPPPQAVQPPPAAEDDDALELTEKVETLGDLDVYTPAADPKPDAGLVSDQAAAAAASAFGKLSAAVAMPAEGRTLEDVVRDMLRPLLQQWLDDNLPNIVQQAVEAEVARIARGGVR